MKRSALVLASVLALAGASAQAFTASWDSTDPLYLTQSYSLKNSVFSDTITFSLASLADVEVSGISNNFGSFGITGGTIELFTSAGSKVGGISFASGTTFDSLLAGDYKFVISGTATGKLGGSYIVNAAVTPVPEPETYALLLGGLGVIGFVARRRKSV